MKRLKKSILISCGVSLGFCWFWVATNHLPMPSELDRLSTDELYLKASQMIAEAPSHALSRDELRPVWRVIQNFHSRDDSSYDQLIILYNSLAKLNLSAVDRMETIRLLGQDQYLRMNCAEAVELLSEARQIPLEELSEIDRELCLDSLGNILYRRGLAMNRLKDSSGDTIDAFRDIVDQPEILRYVDAATVANIFQRLGRLYFQQQKYTEAANAFSKGIATIEHDTEDAKRADRQYRISLEVERVEATVLADNGEKPDYQRMMDRLNSLKKKLSPKKYPDLDVLLRKRVVVADKLDDEDLYVATIQDVRDYFKEKNAATRKWEIADKTYFVDASALLILHHLKDNNKQDAKTVLLETQEIADPNKRWLYRFPKSFVDEALEKSVLDRDER